MLLIVNFFAPALGASCSWGKALDSVVLKENAHTNTIKDSYIVLGSHTANRISGLKAWRFLPMEVEKNLEGEISVLHRLDWPKTQCRRDT